MMHHALAKITPAKPKERQPMADQIELRTADQILAMPDNGDFLAQFMADHQELIISMHQAQMDHGGNAKGSFTIKVDYVLDRTLSLKVQAEAAIKKPKKPRASATLWTTADGMLTPQNPKQMSMFDVRDVTPTRHEIRTT